LLVEDEEHADVALPGTRREHDDSPAPRSLPRVARLALIRPRLPSGTELEGELFVLPRAVVVFDLPPDECAHDVGVQERGSPMRRGPRIPEELGRKLDGARFEPLELDG